MIYQSLMDTPRLYTAIAEWGACLVYILLLRPKFNGFSRIGAIAAALPCFILYQKLADILPLLFWIPTMLGAIGLMQLFLSLLTIGSWKDHMFCCLRAFVLAEFTASLHWQLYVWYVDHFYKENFLLSFGTMLLFYGMIGIMDYRLEKEQFPSDERLNVNSKELTGTLMIALGSFAISNISFAMPGTPFSSATSSILYVRTLVDFGGLVMLYALQDKREELRMRSENQAMNTILQHQYDQYRLSIDNIELLRREFHDLKHYLIAIRAEQNPEKKEQYLLEMEQAIHTQEALSNTGNSVLDVILTTKSTYCLQNNIRFTCMADGKLLSFMYVKDICSIFGNMLDNAIECISQFEDPEKRLITLKMYQQNRLLMVQCENYSENSVSLKPGQLPSTTKKDRSSHGYGLKSIRNSVDKYGGTMTLQSKNNWFTLQILFPLNSP